MIFLKSILKCVDKKCLTYESAQSLVMPDSLQPHELQPTRLLCPWDFPGKNTGAGFHFVLQGIFPTQRSKYMSLLILLCKKPCPALHRSSVLQFLASSVVFANVLLRFLSSDSTFCLQPGDLVFIFLPAYTCLPKHWPPPN